MGLHTDTVDSHVFKHRRQSNYDVSVLPAEFTFLSPATM